jgi:putative ABC transport system permease protein
VLFAPLSYVQAMVGRPDQVTFLEVAALCGGCPIEDIVAELQLVMPNVDVRSLRQVAQSRLYGRRQFGAGAEEEC